MRRLAIPALIVALTACLVPVALARPEAGAQRQATLEQGILREVNRVRASRGLRSLTPSRELRAAATFQSRALLLQGVFEHDTAAGGSFADRMKRFYPSLDAQGWNVGENLLWASPTITPVDAVRMWLTSPPHRKILLDPVWREFGIGALSATGAPGVFAVTTDPVIVVTLDFGSRPGFQAARTTLGAIGTGS